MRENKKVTTSNINKTVAAMSVAQMRKQATSYGIKSASKYKREQLQQMLVEAMVKQSNRSTRVKADKVNNESVESLAKEMLQGVEMLTTDQLMRTNRKVLIVVMKMLHCSKWYRTYDKATMVKKITDAIA